MPDAALVERFGRDLGRLLDEARLCDDRRIGVALSGGPDSCALLLLATAAYSSRVHAITVNHGLRPAAADEAADAARLCAAIGVPHEIACVSIDPGGSVQAVARKRRYEAIGAWADRHGIAAVLTGHHADDQAETMLMRLARGSGLTGLAGIRAVRRDADCAILRPLLDWRKAELDEIVAAAGITPARDPSNDDPRFDRTRARRLLGEADWLDPLRIANSAAHLADAEAALDWMVAHFAEPLIETSSDTASMPTHLPHEVARRLLLSILSHRFAKKPDGPAVERAMAALGRGETVTIADVLVRSDGPRWHLRAAPPRRSV